jgi:hypothetical protein
MPPGRIPSGPLERTYDIKCVARAAAGGRLALGTAPPPSTRAAPARALTPLLPNTTLFTRCRYYSRDVRRGPPAFSRPVEASFTLPEHFRALTPPEPALPSAIDVPVAKPIDGAMKNPDVAKYDPSGLRVTMTANEAAYLRELAKHRANHLPSPSWARSKEGAQWAALNEARGLPPAPGVPKMKRLSPWQYTHDTQW